MAGQDRKSALCAQNKLTGIDFVQVLDHEIQDTLYVYFVIDPDDLVPPLVDTSIFKILSRRTGKYIDIMSANWIETGPPTDRRTVLEIVVEEPGDFSVYAVVTGHGPGAHEQIDHFFSEADFSFKQACPTGLDCDDQLVCPDADLKQINIDYLARDFTSLRGALLDFAAQHYPEWEARVEADQAVMLMEIMAALGDEFAYTQDRYSLEAYLETATQTQSVVNLARLVDYDIDKGEAATTLLTIGANTPHFTNPQNLTDPVAIVDRVYAVREDAGVIPFEIIEKIWVHPNWNIVPLHLADETSPCLPRGTTRAYLKTDLPALVDLPPGTVEADIPDIWIGRRIVLRSGVDVADEPDRAWAVTITGLEKIVDELCRDELDNPINVLCIEWSEDESLPFEMSIAHTVANLNAVNAISGETITEKFRVGQDSDFIALGLSAADLEKKLALPPAIERDGSCSNGGRGVIVRYGLKQSITKGLSWRPEMPGIKAQWAIHIEDWEYVENILDSDAEDQVYTIEYGMWDEIVRYQKPSGDIVHRDYASNDGFTVRFGDGAFGRAPSAGSEFSVTYLSAPGTDANLPTDTIKLISVPGSQPPVISFTDVRWVTNPFPVTSARAAETVDSIRINAPEAYKALPERAVRNEDYREILEREKSIQQANANSRWTGSWTTDFVSVDPIGTAVLTAELRNYVKDRLDCIRQAGRDVCLKEADYVSVDLIICICVDPGHSNAKVIRGVQVALTGDQNNSGFFDNDNFSFGDPLIRSKLEAAIQCVDGVRAVETIDVRLRGLYDFKPLPNRIEIAPNQIIQVANDKAQPETGFIEVNAHGGG